MCTCIPSGVGVKMDPSTWYGVVKGGEGKNEVPKQRRGWTWGEAACTHTQSFPWPLSTPPQSSPSTSHSPLFLALATRSASSAYFALTNTVATPPTHSTISWTTLLHLHLIILTPHTCAATAAAIKGSLVRSVYSTVLFAIHICAPSSYMYGTC